jgi:hypothetical protein
VLAAFSMMAACAEVSNRETSHLSGFLMAQKMVAPPLTGAGKKTAEIGSEALERLFEAFITCRTTFDDLSDRAAALGADLSPPVIAAHLTGRSCISAQKHDVLVTAVNARLAELSLPASARHTFSAGRSG